ncbi:SDH family Clp fold serine proteinase [Rhodoblastus sp.]|uniref:SDH family Clp fold serine proteinase n=1 Tax=Rhodoblastus sp. TaxID=1962975 RepID=UPI003F97DD42
MTKSQNEQRSEKFPRTSELPTQSPLFWVEQKDRYLRQLLIRDIEEVTGRKLLVYFCNRFEPGSDIDQRDCGLLGEIFGDVNGGAVDLMIETNGGNTDATDSIISLLRNLTTDLRVIVANGAKSNGTLIALLAKSILMGPPSELGPIEPSVNNIPSSILTDDIIKAQNFPLHMYGVYALKHTRALAKKLLTDGMMSGHPEIEIDNVVKQLSSRDTYPSHGSSIDYTEAKALGLNIEKLTADDALWKKIWLLHCMYEHDCRTSRYLKVFEGSARSTAVGIPPKPQGPSA